MCNIELWVNAISVKWRHLVASKYFHSIIVEQGVHLIQISSQYEVFLLMSEYVYHSLTVHIYKIACIIMKPVELQTNVKS